MSLLGAGGSVVTGGGGGYSTEANTFISRVNSLNGGSDPAWLDSTRKAAIDNVYVSLKSGAVSGSNILSKIDLLYILGNGDTNAAKINWKNPGTNDLTVNGTPTFTADRGYDAGAVNTNYLSTGWSPSTAGGNFSQNNAHMAMWLLEASASVNYDIGVAAGLNFRNVNGTGRINLNNANTTVTLGSGTGHTCACRSSSTGFESFQNAVSKGTSSVTSATVVSGTLLLLNAASLSADRQEFAAHIGGFLTANEVTDLYNALNAFKTAVGA